MNKFVGVSNSKYRIFGTSLLQSFTRDPSTKVKRWNMQEDVGYIIYRYYFSLIGHSTMEKIMFFVNKYHGKIRIYSEENLIVVEFNITKMTLDQYNQKRNKGEK